MTFVNLQAEMVGVRVGLVGSRSGSGRVTLRIFIGAGTARMAGFINKYKKAEVLFGFDDQLGHVIVRPHSSGYTLGRKPPNLVHLIQVSRVPDYIIRQPVEPTPVMLETKTGIAFKLPEIMLVRKPVVSIIHADLGLTPIPQESEVCQG